MWIRKETVLFDRDTEIERMKEETLKENPLTWDEFRILQSTKTKDIASEFVGLKTEHRDTGIKIQRQQLVLMEGKEFKGEIANYSIWLANNSVDGPITEALRGFNPTIHSEYESEQGLPQLFELRGQCLKLATQYEHLSSTWNCLILDNEPVAHIGQITPEKITAELDEKLEIGLKDNRGIKSFHKRMDSVRTMEDDLKGYSPNKNFIVNMAKLIW